MVQPDPYQPYSAATDGNATELELGCIVRESHYRQTAYWSSVLPFSHIALMILYNTVVASIDEEGKIAYAFGLLGTIILISGICLGAYAFIGVPKYGVKGIALRSVFGIFFGSIMLFVLWRFSEF